MFDPSLLPDPLTMSQGPEDIAREQIDRVFEQAGWAVQDAKAVNLYAKQGVAICEFELKPGFGEALRTTCCAKV